MDYPILWATTTAIQAYEVNPTGFLSTTPGGAREDAVCRRGVAVCCNLALCTDIPGRTLDSSIEAMKTGVMRFQCTLLLIQISSAEAELDIQHSHI
jgi:hypothetical protein